MGVTERSYVKVEIPEKALAISGATHATPATETEESWGFISRELMIQNTHATGILSVSFDGGDSFFDLAAEELALTISIARKSVIVKSATANVTYVGLVG